MHIVKCVLRFRALLMESTHTVFRILSCENIMSTTLLLTAKLCILLPTRDNSFADSRLYHGYSRDHIFKSSQEILQSVFLKHVRIYTNMFTHIYIWVWEYVSGLQESSICLFFTWIFKIVSIQVNLTLHEAHRILDMARGRQRKITNRWYIGYYP